MSEVKVDKHYRNVARAAAPSNAKSPAGLAVPPPLVVASVADAALEPAAPEVLVAEPLPPVTVPDAAPADVELPLSKKTAPVGDDGAIDKVELAVAVLVLVLVPVLVVDTAEEVGVLVSK